MNFEDYVKFDSITEEIKNSNAGVFALLYCVNKNGKKIKKN
jgi:hypothetical protein